MHSKASMKRVYRDVEFLTSIRPFRNWENLESLNTVASYIKGEFEAVGYETQAQTWDAWGNDYTNVIASYLPEKAVKFIVGAHYDVCGNQPGADDNASAVAGLLETARLVAQNQPKLDFGIEFVAYCLEEPPFFNTDLMGSYIHAESLWKEQVKVKGMICYEMIGYFSDEPGSQTYPMPELASMYPDTGNFIVVVGIDRFRDFYQRFYQGMVAHAEIDVEKILFPNSMGLAGLSDQKNYWEFGFPALMINDTSFLRNPHYHEVTDTIETLNFEKMVQVIDASYRGIVDFE